MIKAYIKSLFEKRGFVLGGDLNKNDRAGALHRAWGYVFTNHIPGDYLEFGVYHGTSFVESYKQYKTFENWLAGQLSSPEVWRRKVAMDYSSHRPHFHGLDTFAGMPKNDENNVAFIEGTYLSSYDEVTKRCIEGGIPAGSFTLHRGLFRDSSANLGKVVSEKVAIANIDCDIYASAADALEIIRDRIQVGTVLMFDDYNTYRADNSQGERRAFREFTESVSFEFEPWFAYQYAGQAFLCVG